MSGPSPVGEPKIALELFFLAITAGGFLMAKLSHKVKLPHETGMILLGLLLGPSGALIFSHFSGHHVEQLIPHHALESLSVFSQIALGIMTFTIGTHLTKHSLHNAGKRIMNLAISHTLVTYLAVFIGLLFVAKTSLPVALILAAVSISVAPGTVISVIQKKRARGILTKTLLGVVAISNVTTIFMFDISRAIALPFLDHGETVNLLVVLKSLSGPALTVVWGMGAGWLAAQTTQHLHERKDITAVISLFLIGNMALASHLGLSPLLVNLITGIVYSNLSYHTDTVRGFFGDLEGILFSFFFTMAGTHLEVDKLATAGVAGVVFVGVRFVGQWLSAYIVSKSKNYPKVLGQYLGLAMLPKAGLSIGLLLVISASPEFAGSSETLEIITAVILGAVVVNEIVGPFTISHSLDKAKETDQAAPRLIDFMHEEYILMPLKGNDKWELIENMCQFLIKANHLKTISSDELHQLVLEREKTFPTAIGEHLAVPHARIPGNHKLMGVIGICEKPIDFGALDKKPVHIVILVATPEGEDDLHVKLLAAIARIFSKSEMRESIMKAGSAEEVYTLLQSSEVRDINSYLDMDIT